MIRKVQNVQKLVILRIWGILMGIFFIVTPHDTFLESLGPWECSGGVSRIFGHHQDDQEGPKYPKTDYLEDLGYLDGDFF